MVTWFRYSIYKLLNTVGEFKMKLPEFEIPDSCFYKVGSGLKSKLGFGFDSSAI